MRLVCFAMVFLAVAGAFSQAHAARRVALVIGNSAYAAAASLKNPSNDAKAVAGSLTRLGFDVISVIDSNHDQMRRNIRDFVDRLDPEGVSLLFYAGHGLQVNGQNYLVPIDAELKSETDLEFATINLDFVLTLMKNASKTQIVLLDACRDNPMARSLRPTTRSSGASAGLARPKVSAEGQFIAFATEPDKVALDGNGLNSPFTTALLRNLERPGVEISELMTDVRREVFEQTGKTQLPFANSGLLGKFFFIEPSGGEQQSVSPVVEKDETALRKAREAEEALWASVSKSGNSAMMQVYLDTYPAGIHATEARTEIDRLRSAKPKDGGDTDVALLKRNDDPSRPGLIVKEGAWGMYNVRTDKGPICYMITTPVVQNPADLEHGKVYFMLSHHNSRKGIIEPQLLVGYDLKDNAAVILEVGGRKYTMFSRGASAWMDKPANEPLAVSQMRKSATMTATAVSKRGTRTSYEFSLRGVSSVLDQIEKCY